MRDSSSIMGLKQKWNDRINDPKFLQAFNGWATVVWFAAAIPICVFLADSVPFLVFISVYAVVTGHLSSWQASRVEARQEREEDEQESHQADYLEEIVKRVDEVTPDK